MPPGRTRAGDLPFPRRVLSPTELRGLVRPAGAPHTSGSSFPFYWSKLFCHPYIKKHDIIRFHPRATNLAEDFRWVDERSQIVVIAPISRFPGRKGTAWAMAFIANAILHGAPFTPDEDWGWLRLPLASLNMWCYENWLTVGGNPVALRKGDGYPAAAHTDRIRSWVGVPALRCMTSVWQTPDDRYILSCGDPSWIEDALASVMA